jgi:Leucine-rich repeat (LRR) protein
MSSLKELDVSDNKIEAVLNQNFRANYNISVLDLSRNSLNYIDSNMSTLASLKSLRLANTNSTLILSLNLASFPLIEELDLSFNNLMRLDEQFLASLKQLRALNLSNTQLDNYDYKFLTSLADLDSIDLNNNQINPKYFEKEGAASTFKLLNIANMSLLTIEGLNKVNNLVHLDASLNSLTKLEFGYGKPASLSYLDLSYNQMSVVTGSEFANIVYFKTLAELSYLNLRRGLDEELSNSLFSFNKNLETADLAENELNYFPLFCEYFSTVQNEVCRLKLLYFDSNKLESIKNTDLMNLDNLEHLNLDNNEIEWVEEGSFDNLFKLETLILARNKLESLNSDLFFNLDELKFVNLSSNRIKLVEGYTFNYLKKLEQIDLSRNWIRVLSDNSFFELHNLKELYIFENRPDLVIENASFIQLKSIQSIYLSKPMLTSSNLGLFVELFNEKNRNHTRYILNTSYLKSLDLISFNEVDCNMTLSLIKLNLHFNLKSDSDWVNYLNNCEKNVIK